MERHDERFLRLRTKRADGRSGSGAENRERQASRRYDMTPDTDHPRSQLRRGIMKLEWPSSSLLPVEIEVWPRQPASMASQRTDTSDIPSIGSIREFHVKDESESIAPNYLRLLLLERFSLTVTPRDPFVALFCRVFWEKEQQPYELFRVIAVNICRG